jgi:short chain dehydrogenase
LTPVTDPTEPTTDPGATLRCLLTAATLTKLIRAKTKGFLDAASHVGGLRCSSHLDQMRSSMTRVPTGNSEGNVGSEKVRAGSIDSGHLLLVGAGPGLGLGVAHRFAAGGYRVTLVARSADRLGELARSLGDTDAEVNTVEADASSPEDLRGIVNTCG